MGKLKDLIPIIVAVAAVITFSFSTFATITYVDSRINSINTETIRAIDNLTIEVRAVRAKLWELSRDDKRRCP